MNRVLALPFGWVVALVVSGCTTYTTPDGCTLRSGSRTGQVRSMLGDPDLIDEYEGYMWGSYTTTVYTYLSRGYSVYFMNHWVRGVHPIAEHDRADIERRAVAFRNEVSKTRIGDQGRELLSRYGPPDFVVMHVNECDTACVERSGNYAGELERLPPPKQVLCYWAERSVFVDVKRGRVVEARPLSQRDLGFKHRAVQPR